MKFIYCPEIDDLKVITVSAIVLYHAKIIILDFQPFKVGLIGVDLFFLSPVI